MYRYSQKRSVVFLGKEEGADEIGRHLSSYGLDCQRITIPQEVSDKAQQDDVGAIVIDQAEIAVSASELASLIRRLSFVPIAVVPASDDLACRIDCLYSGADQVVERPLGKASAARIHALWRRAYDPEYLWTKREEYLEFGSLKIFPGEHRVVVKDKEIQLTPREYELLLCLVRVPDRVVSTAEILCQWGYRGIRTNTVDMHVCRLRRKIETTPSEPSYIVTVHGCGYKFVSP